MGHVFTYYKQVTSEASDMITGLGKLVLRRYGKEMAAKMFSLDHFKGNSGYRWNEEKGRFSTPLDRQMKSNYRFDNNLQAVNILNDLEVEENTKKENENKSKSKSETVSKAMLIVEGHKDKKTSEEKESSEEEEIRSQSSLTTTGRLVRDTQMVDMIDTIKDPDLDSLTDVSIKQCMVQRVTTEDDALVASSLTNQSVSDVSNVSPSLSVISVDTNISDRSSISSVMAGSKKNNNKSIIEKIALSFEGHVTDEQLRQAVSSFHNRNYNKSHQLLTAELEKYLESRKSSSPSAPSYSHIDSDNEAEENSTASGDSFDSQDTNRLQNFIESVEEAKGVNNDSTEATTTDIPSSGSDLVNANGLVKNDSEIPSHIAKQDKVEDSSITSNTPPRPPPNLKAEDNNSTIITASPSPRLPEEKVDTNSIDNHKVSGTSQPPQVDEEAGTTTPNPSEEKNIDVANHILQTAQRNESNLNYSDKPPDQDGSNQDTKNSIVAKEETGTNLDSESDKPKKWSSNSASHQRNIVPSKRQSARLAQVDKQSQSQRAIPASSDNTGNTK